MKKTKQDGKADAGKTLLLLEAGYALTNFSVTPTNQKGVDSKSQLEDAANRSNSQNRETGTPSKS